MKDLLDVEIPKTSDFRRHLDTYIFPKTESAVFPTLMKYIAYDGFKHERKRKRFDEREQSIEKID